MPSRTEMEAHGYVIRPVRRMTHWMEERKVVGLGTCRCLCWFQRHCSWPDHACSSDRCVEMAPDAWERPGLREDLEGSEKDDGRELMGFHRHHVIPHPSEVLLSGMSIHPGLSKTVLIYAYYTWGLLVTPPFALQNASVWMIWWYSNPNHRPWCMSGPRKTCFT